MRKLVVALTLGILLAAAPAHAALFTLSSVNVNYNQSGLALNWSSPITNSNPLSFSLATVGETYEAALFQIGTNQNSLNVQSVIPQEISVALNFTAPPPGFAGTGNGLTGAGWFFGNFGYVVWNNPAVLSFGNGGLLGVSLSNVTFGMPGSATVSATFKLLQASSPITPGSQPPVGVPEPSSALMLILGSGVLAMVPIRRRRQRS